MWPSIRSSMQNKIQNILPTFNNFSNITKLEIGGIFQPYYPSVKLNHIQSLHVEYMELLRSLEREFVCFLSAFPEVQDLSVTLKQTENTQFLPMHNLSFPLLRSFKIKGLVVTETSMFDFIITQPPEATITLHDISLQRRSWKSLAKRLQDARRLLFCNEDANSPVPDKPFPCHHSLDSCPICRNAELSINVS